MRAGNSVPSAVDCLVLALKVTACVCHAITVDTECAWQKVAIEMGGVLIWRLYVGAQWSLELYWTLSSSFTTRQRGRREGRSDEPKRLVKVAIWGQASLCGGSSVCRLWYSGLHKEQIRPELQE